MSFKHLQTRKLSFSFLAQLLNYKAKLSITGNFQEFIFLKKDDHHFI